MKFLLGLLLFNNNIFVQLDLFRIQETTMLQNKIKDKFNGIQVTNFNNRSTESLNYRIYAQPPSIKQDDQSFISRYIRLPETRWVKLSLNFELLVNRVMKFLLGQRLFNNNIFCTT